MSERKYVVNPLSGRSIIHGGALHRKLIKDGKMPQVAFATKRAVSYPRKSAKELVKETINKKVQKKEVPKPTKPTLSKEERDKFVNLLNFLTIENGRDGDIHEGENSSPKTSTGQQETTSGDNGNEEQKEGEKND